MRDDLISKRPGVERMQVITEGGEWLFSLSVVAVILVTVAWGGLFFYRRTLETNVANWREQINRLEQEMRPDLINQLIMLSNKLASAREVLTNHNFAANTISLVEKDVHPQVYFSNFQYSSQNRSINLSAKAASYGVVADQVTLLEADPQIEKVNFGGLSLDEKGLVSFKLTIIFKPSLLKLRL